MKLGFQLCVLGSLAAGLRSAPAEASMADCKDVYVIETGISMVSGLPWAVLAASPNGSGGWNQAPASGLPDRYYQQIQAVLLTAKATRAPISVATTGPANCGISAGAQTLTGVWLSETP